MNRSSLGKGKDRQTSSSVVKQGKSDNKSGTVQRWEWGAPMGGDVRAVLHMNSGW
jgi:hypothetical protein